MEAASGHRRSGEILPTPVDMDITYSTFCTPAIAGTLTDVSIFQL
jgi:hypothetical protein